VTVTIVDRLEVIDVARNERHGDAGAAGALEFQRAAFLHGAAIVQCRERIGARLSLQLHLQCERAPVRRFEHPPEEHADGHGEDREDGSADHREPVQ
jgi:hypothetical protein